MKISLYFKDKAEYDAYWQGNEPGSKFKCVILKKKRTENKNEKSQIEIKTK